MLKAEAGEGPSLGKASSGVNQSIGFVAFLHRYFHPKRSCLRVALVGSDVFLLSCYEWRDRDLHAPLSDSQLGILPVLLSRCLPWSSEKEEGYGSEVVTWRLYTHWMIKFNPGGRFNNKWQDRRRGFIELDFWVVNLQSTFLIRREKGKGWNLNVECYLERWWERRNQPKEVFWFWGLGRVGVFSVINQERFELFVYRHSHVL